MALTGQAASFDDVSVIEPHLRMASIFEVGSVSSRSPSSNWTDLRVSFHCSNSVWPWSRLFTVHEISTARRIPACAMQKAPQRFASQG